MIPCACRWFRRRIGADQCASVFVYNGHRHECCSIEPHAGAHFAHCADPCCVALGREVLPAFVPVVAVSLSWSSQALDEQPRLGVRWAPPRDRPSA